MNNLMSNFSGLEMSRMEMKKVKGGMYISCSITYYNSTFGWTTTSYSTNSTSPAQAGSDAVTSYSNATGSCTSYGTNDKFRF